MIGWRRVKLVVCMMLFALALQAHEVRPARLVIDQQTDSTYHVSWKLPAIKEGVLRLSPIFEVDHEVISNDPPRDLGDAYVTGWTIQPNEPIAGTDIEIQGLENTITDVFVTIQLINGNESSFLVRPRSPRFQFLSNRTNWQVIKDYIILGIEHIWIGYDHLLFVLCLVWLINGFKKLIKTITAFTVAHSITLGASALGIITLPSAPVEAIIALSIVFLAVEIIQHSNNKKVFTSKYPWAVALVFGLLHGFGFAGALTEIGLPNNAIPISLLGFNLGVEIGQVLFIIAIILAIKLLNSFWLIERVVGFM